MRVVCYLGPSLGVAEARRILDIEYRPPARSLDLLREIDAGVDAIVIIDGLFEQVSSVRHKEILYALHKGIAVYGASSMGALRAAELAAFGMVGVGRIFEAFHSGEWADDDEVTISHASAEFGFRPLSDAMANIRDGLRKARAAGLLEAEDEVRLVAVGKEIFYPDRTWQALFGAATKAGMDEAMIGRLSRFVKETKPDLKREDAISVLERVKRDLESGTKPPAVDFDFEQTSWFDMVFLHSARLRNVLTKPSAAGVTGEQLATHVRLWGSPQGDELKHALVTMLAARQYFARATERDPEALGNAAEDLAPFSFHQEWILEQVAAAPPALETYHTGKNALDTDAYLVLSVASDDRVASFHDAIAERSRWLEEQGLARATLESAGVARDELLRWVLDRRDHLEADSFEDLAALVGVADPAALVTDALAQYLFETRRNAE